MLLVGFHGISGEQLLSIAGQDKGNWGQIPIISCREPSGFERLQGQAGQLGEMLLVAREQRKPVRKSGGGDEGSSAVLTGHDGSEYP